jgi:putative nucleotidyltransferase with HDIG domain
VNEPIDVTTQNRIRTIVGRTTELKPLKAVAAKAIALAEDERSATMDLASVISADAVLTAKLLKLSNSAYYGYARRISTVREAIILLGTRTVRSVAIATGIMDALEIQEPPGFSRDLFWAHSVTVGLVAEAIARSTRVARPEDAFTAGVLHDVGKLAMMLVEPQLFAKTVDMVNAEGQSFREAELHTFGLTHEAVGARLAQSWKFPDLLVEGIRGHHAPSPGGGIVSLAEAVGAADLACNRIGMAGGFDWTLHPERHGDEELPEQALDGINRVHGGMTTLGEKARAFLVHVSSKPPRWYSTRLPEDDESTEGDEIGESAANAA